MGYTRVPTVTEVAQFSVRGGILDAYGFGMAAPARIEWWGDEIVSLRSFDLDSQRSGEPVDRVTVLPVKTEATARRDDGTTERRDRKSTRLNSSHGYISYAVFCLKKKKKKTKSNCPNRRN